MCISYAMFHLCFLFYSRPSLRSYLIDGHFFIVGVLAGTLTKLAIRYFDAVQDQSSCNVS